MAKQARSLYGKVVAITGGGRGIGRATAETLSREGAQVAIGDLDLEVAEATAAELGSRVKAFQMDVTDRDSFRDFLDAVEADLGPLDVLINNAGVMILGDFDREDDAKTDAMVAINLSAVLSGTKLAIERMKPRGSGQIVNIASQAGKTGFPGGATYCATKFGVVGLCQAVRGELEGTGVEITCVMPSLVDTELAAGATIPKIVDLLSTEEVAGAIAEALRSGREEVWLPKMTRIFQPAVAILPGRAQKAVGRALGTDHVLYGADAAARAGYEDRASRSSSG